LVGLVGDGCIGYFEVGGFDLVVVVVFDDGCVDCWGICR